MLVVRGCDLDESQPWLCFSSCVHACVDGLRCDMRVRVCQPCNKVSLAGEGGIKFLP